MGYESRQPGDATTDFNGAMLMRSLNEPKIVEIGVRLLKESYPDSASGDIMDWRLVAEIATKMVKAVLVQNKAG